MSGKLAQALDDGWMKGGALQEILSTVPDSVTTQEVEAFKNEHGGHWSEHPDLPLADWRHEVQEDSTRLGYWEWVYKQLLME